MLRLYTLGRLELVRSGPSITELVPVQPKRLALLAYLLLAPASGVRRETLIALFWPEATEDEGRRALRQALYHLRQFLGDGVLVSRSDEAVAVAEGFLWCDAVAFEGALRAGNAAEALERYGGDFLEGCFVSEVAPDFEQWTDQVRSRLRRRAAHALWALADQESGAGRPVAAIDAARRARDLSPDDERGTRQLISLLDRFGDRGGALREYQDHVDRLTREFGAEPSAETRALGNTLRSAPSVRPHVPPTNGAVAKAEPLALVVEPLAAPPPPTADAAPPEDPRPRRAERAWLQRAWVGAAAVLALALAGFAVVRTSRPPHDPTLLESGRVALRDRVLVADFHNGTRDSLLAGAVTEALRADLAQSRVVRLMSAQQVQSGLRRMQQPANAPLVDSVVRHLAVREGAKAYVTGDIAAVGPRFTLSAQLVSTESGELLAAVRETASDSTELLTALGRLSRAMRIRIGESMRTIKAGRPLDQVTTSSLQALRLYSQSTQAIHFRADRAKGRALLEEAITLDTAFASAYSRLGIEYEGIGEYGRATEMHTQAFRNRDRMGERERAMTSALYYTGVMHDYERGIAAYRTMLEIDPTDVKVLNNLGFLHTNLRDFAPAEEFYVRALHADSSIVVVWNGLQEVLINRGKYAEARRVIDGAHARFPGNLHVEYTEVSLAAGLGDYNAAEQHSRLMAEGSPDDAVRKADGYRNLADIALLRGHVGASRRYRRAAMRLEEEGGYLAHFAVDALSLAALDAVPPSTSRSDAGLSAALARHPIDSIPPRDRPYVELASMYAAAGDAERVRTLARDFARNGLAVGRFGTAAHHHMLGAAALADARYDDAIVELRQAAEGEECTICALPELARAYDRRGSADSAIAVYERYLTTPWRSRLELDAVNLHRIYERLGELYEGRHEPGRAAAMYRRLVTLWRDADRELRPRVTAVERRLAALAVEP